MPKPTLPETMMAIAQQVSERSTCSSEIKVGAVLTTPEYFIISTGYNGAPSGLPHCDDVGCDREHNGPCQRVIHAEENAILQCAIRGVSSRGAYLFSNYFPCIRCAYRIIQAGIHKVYYSKIHKDSAAAREMFRTAGVQVIWLDN